METSSKGLEGKLSAIEAVQKQSIEIEVALKQLEEIRPALSRLVEVSKTITTVHDAIMDIIGQVATTTRLANFKAEEIKPWLQHVWAKYQTPKRDEIILALPRFVTFSVGWWDHSDEGYNYFKVNQYTDWLAEVPVEIRKELGLRKPDPLKIEGDALVATGTISRDTWQRYRPFLKERINEQAYRIRPRLKYPLAVQLVKDGILPYSPNPFPKEAIEEREVGFESQPWQEDVRTLFRKFSNVGIFAAQGAGKTFAALRILCDVKPEPPHLVIMKDRRLVIQWLERIEALTPLQLGKDVIVETFAMALRRRLFEKPWNILVVDEVQDLPADTFSRMAYINCRGRIGLSGSPFREDGRSVGYSEPILYKQSGTLHLGKVGPLIDSYLTMNESAKHVTDLEVLSLDSKTMELAWRPVRQVSRHVHNGNLRKIATTSGREIVVTDKHSIMVLGSDFRVTPKKVSEIGEGEILVAPKKQTDHQSQVSPAWARLLGWYIAEGSMTARKGQGYQVNFSLNNREEAEAVSRDLLIVGLSPHIYSDRNAFKVSCTSKKAYELFSSLVPATQKAWTKRVPPVILNSSLEVMQEYWNAYWSGDKGITVNRDLASDHAYLLGLMGKHALIQRSTNEGTFSFPDGHKVSQSCLRFIVSPSQGRTPFSYLPIEFIETTYAPILTRRRKDKAMKRVASFSVQTFQRVIGQEAFDRLSLLSLTKREGRVTTSMISKLFNKTKTTAEAYLRLMKSRGLIQRVRIGHRYLGDAIWTLTSLGESVVDAYARMSRLLEANISFVRVKENVATDYSQHFVYDLNVPDSQTFVAGFGGLLCHNTELIFALTGYPYPLPWQETMRLKGITAPNIYVWFVKDFQAKITKTRELLEEQPTLKTFIYCDHIEPGKTLAKVLDAPFVFGDASPEKSLEVLRKNPVVVVSRVGDRGLSFADIERIIEVDFLYGSRQQALQRTGRLLHSEYKTVHHILMTPEEYERYRKRLMAYEGKGLRLEFPNRREFQEQIHVRTAISPKLLPTYRVPKIAQREEREGEPEAQAPLPTGPVADILRLPGVQKIMGLLSKPEQKFWQLLLQNDGQWFRRDKLPLLLGYAGDSGLRHAIDFNRMEEKGLIEITKIEGKLAYRTNMRARAS